MTATFAEILARGLLVPRFQAVISLAEARIFGYEATVRGPLDGPLNAPLSLFYAAQRQGRLVELDLLCQQVAIRDFAHLRLPGRLFINFTAATLLRSDFSPDHTLQYLDRFGLGPKDVVIELTEQHPIDDFDVMRRTVIRCRNIGFAVAIDDLGAGYAGLRLWEELRPDYVKIDRHFIQGIDENPGKLHFVRSMQELASALGCRVIAEGVESRAELLALDLLGVELVQGYYFAKPQGCPPRFLPSRHVADLRPDSPGAVAEMASTM
jgi:EAL domain-containing protein (putative c-di-GMP-specific phosphodiesterase class I)